MTQSALRFGRPTDDYQLDREWATRLWEQGRVHDLPPSIRDFAQMATAYKHGYSIEAIAMNYNRSYATVHRWVLYFGCKLRPRGKRSPMTKRNSKGAAPC